MNRMLKGGAVVVAALGLVAVTGCFDSPLDIDKDSVAIPALVSEIEAPAGQSSPITGRVDASEVPTLRYVVTDAAGNESDDIGIAVLAPTAKRFNFEDLNLMVTPRMTACSGPYRLTITATVGNTNASKFTSILVTGATCQVAPDIDTVHLTMGSWNNTQFGSSLEADAMRVYRTTEVTAALQKEIDVWFSTTGDNKPVFWSPRRAAVADYAPKNWTDQNATKMKKITVAGDIFAQLDAAADINVALQTLWAGGTNAVEYLEVAAGDVVLIQTNTGAIKVVYVVQAQTTHTGIALIIGVR